MASASIHSYSDQTNILVYMDEGVNEQSALALQKELSCQFPEHTPPHFVTSKQLLTTDWEKDTYILAMGGGTCSKWETSLGHEGMMRIHNFVTTMGGVFLGICAGGYFASHTSAFACSEYLQIFKERPVDLFPGCAIGPLDLHSSLFSPDAAKAVTLKTPSGEQGTCYYQGGSAFISSPEPKNPVHTIAAYDTPFSGDAIIVSYPGKGVAILSGPHIEYSWSPTTASPRTSSPIPEEQKMAALAALFMSQEPFRKSLWDKIRDVCPPLKGTHEPSDSKFDESCSGEEPPDSELETFFHRTTL